MAILNYIRDITKYVMFDNQGGGWGPLFSAQEC